MFSTSLPTPARKIAALSGHFRLRDRAELEVKNLSTGARDDANRERASRLCERLRPRPQSHVPIRRSAARDRQRLPRAAHGRDDGPHLRALPALATRLRYL